MNQATNLIQYKNLPEEVQADHNFENYEYEYQDFYDWKVMNHHSPHYAYRLVIEDDQWYTRTDDDGQQLTTLGKDIDEGTIKYALSIRPARPDEIPQPEKTLEDKIKEKWPDKEAFIMGWEDDGLLCFDHPSFDEVQGHIVAQSMEGFYRYAYEIEGQLESQRWPTFPWNNTTLQPVAVLFEVSK